MFARSSPTDPVIVVGAGPAGATAALALASAGIGVRLLDRSAFPRNKPCGGGISSRVLQRFPYLVRALPRIATHGVSRLHLEGPDGRSAAIDTGGTAALMIRRVEFDALLVALAVEAGAQLITGADIVQVREDDERVTLTTQDGKQFTSPVVIAADGVNSVVARRLGINKGWPPSAVALDMMEETPRTLLRDVDSGTLWVAYGYNPQENRDAASHAAERRLRVTPTSFQNAITSTSASVMCCRTSARRSIRRLTTCNVDSSSACPIAASSSAGRCARTLRRRSFRSAARFEPRDAAGCCWPGTREASSTR